MIIYKIRVTDFKRNAEEEYIKYIKKENKDHLLGLKINFIK
jgi:hypothetical protein